MKYKHYTEEFRQSVIREYLSSNMSMYACARKFGIRNRSSLSRWLKEYGYKQKPSPKKGFSGDFSHKSEEDYKNKIVRLNERIAQLEIELERLRQISRVEH